MHIVCFGVVWFSIQFIFTNEAHPYTVLLVSGYYVDSAFCSGALFEVLHLIPVLGADPTYQPKVAVFDNLGMKSMTLHVSPSTGIVHSSFSPFSSQLFTYTNTSLQHKASCPAFALLWLG